MATARSWRDKRRRSREHDGGGEAPARTDRELGAGRRVNQRPPVGRIAIEHVDTVAHDDEVADLQSGSGGRSGGVDRADLVPALFGGSVAPGRLGLKAEHTPAVALLETRFDQADVADIDGAAPADRARDAEPYGLVRGGVPRNALQLDQADGHVV